GAQLVGGVLAGACLRVTFPTDLLTAAHMGTPHLSPQAFPQVTQGTLLTGTGIELVLTFFLVFAIFGTTVEASRTRLAGLAGGLVLTAAVLVAYPLTGAATNPARWFGTVFWEMSLPVPTGTTSRPLQDTFVYLAGPIVGALLA